MNTFTYRLGLLILALIGSLPFTGDCAAATRLWVANNGVDSPGCASISNPCRSISQAIDNASDGDTIFVGPGHYGDVSGNGTFSGPGDEHPQTFADGDGCIVCITKSLHIYSVSGAAVTVIAGPALPANAAAPWPANVEILHDGVDFGSAGHGFTLTGGNGMGVEFNWGTVDGSGGGEKNMTVAGNIDLGDAIGFVYSGFPFTGPIFECPPQCTTARTVFSDNQALNDAVAGFKVTVNADRGPGLVIFENNLALGGGGGFIVDGGAICHNCPEIVATNIVQLLNNVATQTAGVGFLAQLPGEVSGNTASYNAVAGFLIVPAGAGFEHNSAVGNGGPGVLIDWSPDSITPVGGNFKTFSLNNLFGNDRNRPVISLFWSAQLAPNGYNPGPSAHCGILNVGGVAAVLNTGEGPPPPAPLAANYDYWGAPSGPKASGAGDTIGGACDQNGGVTTAKFPAATAYAVTTWP